MSYFTPTSTKLAPGRARPQQCGHQGTPMIVMEVEEGYYMAQCLTCGTVGLVQQSPQAARQELTDEGAQRSLITSSSRSSASSEKVVVSNLLG